MLFTPISTLSGAVIAVDLDVIIGQVTAPGYRLTVTVVEVYVNGNILDLNLRTSNTLDTNGICVFWNGRKLIPVIPCKLDTFLRNTFDIYYSNN